MRNKLTGFKLWLFWFLVIIVFGGWYYFSSSSKHLEYFKRGNNYFKQGLYDQAIAEYNKTVKIDSNFAKAYYNRGLAYHNQELYEQAIADYSKAIEIEPKDAIAYINRGFIYEHQELYEQAIADYSKAIDIDSTSAKASTNARLAAIYGSLAWCYLFNKQFKQTIKAAWKGLDIKSNQTWIRKNLAHGYLFDGQFATAKEIYVQNKDIVIHGEPWSEVILEDFQKLKEKGIYHADMEKIITLLQ